MSKEPSIEEIIKDSAKNMEKLSFACALYEANIRVFRNSGFRESPDYHQKDDDLKPNDYILALEKISHSYLNKIFEPELSYFLDWLKGHFLDEWKATAHMYNNIFDYFEIDSFERDYVDFFHRIRKTNGSVKGDLSDLVFLGRTPGVLQGLLEDGYITKDQIDPPLKKSYPKPKDLPFCGKKQLSDGTKFNNLIQVKHSPQKQIIATSIDDITALPHISENLPRKLNDNDALSELININHHHRIIYSGTHVMFLQSYTKLNDETIIPRDTYRVSLFNQTEVHDLKNIIRLGKHKLLLTKERNFSDETKSIHAASDINSNTTPIDNYVGITDLNFKDFHKNHIRDFIAHAFVFSNIVYNNQNTELDLSKISTIKNPPKHISSMTIGIKNKVYLSAFEFGGKFAFRLKGNNDRRTSDVYLIANSLTKFIQDLGISVHKEVSLDRYGEYMLRHKNLERKFFLDNIDFVLSKLSGEGFSKTILNCIYDKNYSTRINEYPIPCQTCGGKFISGTITMLDTPLNEYRQNSKIEVKIEDLYTLSNHTTEFNNNTSNFRNIVYLLNHLEKTTPVFLEHPEITPYLKNILKLYTKASKAYDSWREAKSNTIQAKSRLDEIEELKKCGQFQFRNLNEENCLQYEWNYENLKLKEKFAKQKESAFYQRFESARKRTQQFYSNNIIPKTNTSNIRNDIDWFREADAYCIYSTVFPEKFKFLVE